MIFWASVSFNFVVQSVYIGMHDNNIYDMLSWPDQFQSVARVRTLTSHKTGVVTRFSIVAK